VEPRSPFMGESQPGQVPLYRTRQRPMTLPPSQIWTRWFDASFPGNPWRENPKGSMLEDVEPSMGLRMRHVLATLCVASSLAVVTLGGSDLTGGFCL
jgi:hypothetical protein